MSDHKSIIPEGFREIPGYPRYAINQSGTILSICVGGYEDKTRLWSDAKKINADTDKDGYPRVSLIHNGRRLTAKVHKLVLLTFVGQCPNGMQCRHLDGNKTNNHVLNLAWGTRAENANDKMLHGTTTKGEKSNTAKLTADDVIEIRKRFANGETQTAIAKDFSVTQSSISLIVLRQSWRHLP